MLKAAKNAAAVLILLLDIEITPAKNAVCERNLKINRLYHAFDKMHEFLDKLRRLKVFTRNFRFFWASVEK